MSEYESHYDSGGGMLMSNNETGYGYNNSNTNSNSSASGKQSSSNSGLSSTVKTSFFQSSNQSKYDDLKQMLESSKELLKLEAMKRIITMVAKGRSSESARELFPHVVKNVVTKNTELKKLVYLYLTRYAEQEQDLALLSIATFQHALKDPNPLIRGSAIRVLSSIRVPMISPIVLIAIKDCANDMSPYVRKTAAHAIPKLVSLDPEIKEEVIDIIAKLLADKVSLVLGSAIAAFEEVCPERFDLIHQNYRKLCQLLVDVDEWGQILIINMLVRYARTQFINPNQNAALSSPAKIDPDHMLLIRSVKPLLQSRNSGVVLAVIQLYLSVAPHFEITASLVRPLIRLLHSHYEIQLVILKNIVTLTSAEFNQKWLEENNLCKTKPNASSSPLLLNSNGAADVNQSAKANSDSSIADNDGDSSNPEQDDDSDDQSPTLIRTIKSLFEPYLKSFFVKANDSTQIKILKLEILTNLSNSGNYISLVLREFQAYIQNYQDDLEFMSATIESIGQCASRIKEIAPVCLNGLVALLSNRNETIVAQSIVVIRTQIINKDDSIISMIVKQIVKLMDKISTPQARATIVWIVAEFCSQNLHARRLAPNVLLQIAKSFAQEHDLVKLQALNLAVKLYITMIDPDPAQPELESLEIDKERLKMLINYVFNLAKYDLNYDVRDRGRFLKQLINEPVLARKILLVPKQVPNISQRTQLSSATGIVPDPSSQQIQSNTCMHLANSNDSARFRFGTLSHFLGKKLSEYEELPNYPQTPQDASVRKQPEPVQPISTPGPKNRDDKYSLRPRNGFLNNSDYDEDEDEEDEDEDEEEDGDEDEDEEKDDEGYEKVEEQSNEEDDEEDEEYEEEADEDDDEEEEDDDSDEDDQEEEKKSNSLPRKNTHSSKAVNSQLNKSKKPVEKNSEKDIDFLLDLSDLNIGGPTTTMVSGSLATPLHQPLVPWMTDSNQLVNQQSISNNNQPFRVLESAELVTYKEFCLLDVSHEFKVSYRFPRINENQRTLVELVIKSQLTDDADQKHNLNITIQAPANGSVLFKNVECNKENVVTISQLAPQETRLVTISVDFNESPSLGIELKFNRDHQVKLVAPLGDILYPVRFRSQQDFQNEQSKLTGMNEVISVITVANRRQKFDTIPKFIQCLNRILLNLANVSVNQHLDLTGEPSKPLALRYSACTVKFRSLILITIELNNENGDHALPSDSEPLIIKTIVNCEKMVLGSIMSKMIKDEFLKQL